MVKRSRPSPYKNKPLAELGLKYSAQREAERKRVFDGWNGRLEGRPPPTKRELRSYCQFLIVRPHLIEGPYAPSIFLILQDWFAKTPPPKRPSTAKQDAAVVDWVIETEKIPPGKARQKVAEAFGMTVEAVKQNHLRHGKSELDKSR
jgi:hypothetical protein